MKNRSKKYDFIVVAVLLYLILYGLISYGFLTDFPFVHSDESWLSGLTRNMMERASLGVTEPFFDAKPRVPHAIKLLYHLLQMEAIHLFGYSVDSVRLLSLVAGIISLFFVYLVGKRLGGSLVGAGLMVIVSLDIQVIYASHFARQEMVLCISLLACVWILIKSNGLPSVRQMVCLGLITGLSVGIHPNSFLCATMCGCVMLPGILREKGQKRNQQWKRLGIYVLITGAIAMVFVGISFYFDPHFLLNYFRYGEGEFELSRSAWGRLGEFSSFFKTIYRQESGTYYLPDLRLELIGFLAAGLMAALAWLVMRKHEAHEKEVSVWCKHTELLLECLVGLAIGMIIIGRYNQTAILYFIVLGWFLVGQVALLFEKQGRYILLAVVAALVFWGSFRQIQEERTSSSSGYEHYLEQLAAYVPSSARTLGNLNMDFYFENGMLRDFRNLPYAESGQGLETYIEENQIEYICYFDELDYILEHRPYYNTIYGNAMFIKTLGEYCQTTCERVGSFYNETYGTRIRSLKKDGEYGTVTIYKCP